MKWEYIAVPGFGYRQNGFTLIELMITIIVVAIVAGFALPWMGQMIRDYQMTSQGNSLLGGMQYARGESLARGSAVLMCGSSDGTSCDGQWGRGWIVFADDNDNDSLDGGEVLRTETAETDIDSTTNSLIGFTRKGRRADSSLGSLTIKRSDCGQEGSRTLSIAPGGRISLTSGGC